jgi:hypothetical protein
VLFDQALIVREPLGPERTDRLIDQARIALVWIVRREPSVRTLTVLAPIGLS